MAELSNAPATQLKVSEHEERCKAQIFHLIVPAPLILNEVKRKILKRTYKKI